MVLMNELDKTKHKPKSLKRIALNDSSLSMEVLAVIKSCHSVYNNRKKGLPKSLFRD
jgi:hypothetical protein